MRSELFHEFNGKLNNYYSAGLLFLMIHLHDLGNLNSLATLY